MFASACSFCVYVYLRVYVCMYVCYVWCLSLCVCVVFGLQEHALIVLINISREDDDAEKVSSAPHILDSLKTVLNSFEEDVLTRAAVVVNTCTFSVCRYNRPNVMSFRLAHIIDHEFGKSQSVSSSRQ